MTASEDIYKYLGLGIVVLFVAYVVIKSLTFQAKLFEGMTSGTDKDKKAESIKSNTTSVLDALLIEKYRSNYVDTIIELEENISATILSGILTNSETISADPSSETSQKFITSTNNLKAFKDTLNDAMKYLDSIKN
jgi:hypothetical protein